MAVLTSGQVISEDLDLKRENVIFNMLERVEKPASKRITPHHHA